MTCGSVSVHDFDLPSLHIFNVEVPLEILKMDTQADMREFIVSSSQNPSSQSHQASV